MYDFTVLLAGGTERKAGQKAAKIIRFSIVRQLQAATAENVRDNSLLSIPQQSRSQTINVNKTSEPEAFVAFHQ
jgi:hypothetical protein